jgi:hypothetical protein
MAEDTAMTLHEAPTGDRFRGSGDVGLLLPAAFVAAAALALIGMAALLPQASDHVGAVILAAIGSWAAASAAMLARRERRTVRLTVLGTGVAATVAGAGSGHGGLVAMVMFPVAVLGLAGGLLAAGIATVMRRHMATWPILACLCGLSVAVAVLFLGSLLMPDSASAPEAASSAGEELRRMYAADQGDRRSGRMLLDAGRDRRRLARTLRIVKESADLAPEARLHAAVLLLHGTCPDHFRAAAELAAAAARAGVPEAERIARAATDRWLLSTGRDQRHGTQLFALELGRRPCQLPEAALP